MPAIPNGPGHSDWLVIEGFVEAFEAARCDEPDADLERFLPPVGHPLRDNVLCELIRVDLELGWERGAPRRLEHYRERFPALFGDPNRAKEIAYEEFRLRRRAGH